MALLVSEGVLKQLSVLLGVWDYTCVKQALNIEHCFYFPPPSPPHPNPPYLSLLCSFTSSSVLFQSEFWPQELHEE